MSSDAEGAGPSGRIRAESRAGEERLGRVDRAYGVASRRVVHVQW